MKKNRLIDETKEIGEKWKELKYQYDEQRINKIITQLTKIKNYEFKNSKHKG